MSSDLLFVSTNGALSFSSPLHGYNAGTFPASGVMIIAPYWSDVDIRPLGGGNIYYRETSNASLLVTAENIIHSAFYPDYQDFSTTFLFITTWDHVGYYDRHTDKTNTFQCILATNTAQSFVLFLYADNELQWTTGDASGGTLGLGGTPAQVGLNAGDGVHYYTIPGSQTPNVINIVNSSNVATPGLWVFKVDGENIDTPTSSSTNETESATSSPSDLNGFCSVVSSVVRITEPEHVEEIAHDILEDVLPELLPSVMDRVNSSNTSALEATYESLAGSLGTPTSETGYTEFVEALNEIAIAEANACSSSIMLNITQLASEFSVAFSRELTDENLQEIRRLFGELLCAESMEQEPSASPGTVGCPSRDTCACPAGGIDSPLTCACEFFACLDPMDHLGPIFGLSQQTHRCLAFIVDTTGSMGAEISAVRTIILDFVRSEEDLNEIRCYILVPFNDYGSVSNSVGPITIAASNDPAELQSFYSAVQALIATGGGDYPEYALDGMLQGLQATKTIDGITTELMVSGSQMIVLTDATSKRPEITDTVITEATSRGVCIHFFVSDSGAISDGIFSRVATETSGTLINNFANWQLASFISASASNPCRYTSTLTTSRRKRSTSSHATFDVSVFSFLIQLSISASSGATISITRPDGTSTTMIASANFAVFSEGNPQPGRWSASVNYGVIQLSVTQEIAVDTTILYVVGKANETTPTPPQACLQGQIAIVSSHSHQISSPELTVGLANGTSQHLPLTNCSNVLLSEPFAFPHGTVNYQLVGYDTNGVMFEHSIDETATFTGSPCNVNECALHTDNCHSNAYCVDTEPDFRCICMPGYEGSGQNCHNIDECSREVDSCSIDAQCIDTQGSHYCTCNSGFSGDGKLCSDIDECLLGTHNCDDHADCSNILGSYDCVCTFGYTGNGVVCNEIKPPDVPRSLRVTSVTLNTVTLEWQPPANLSVEVDAYELTLSESQFDLPNISVILNTTTIFLEGLQEYNTYTCDLRAVSIYGAQSQPVIIEFITLEGVPTSPPQNVTITSQNSTQVAFEWSPPPAIEINGHLQFYIVQLTESRTGRGWSITVSDTQIELDFLHPYYTYTFTVAAVTIGHGSYSDTYMFVTDEDVPTGYPQDITIIDVTSTTLTLTWHPPLFEETNGLIRYYVVKVFEVETGLTSILTSNVTSIHTRNLHPYYRYVCNVAAYTIGIGPYSDGVTVQLAEEGPSAAPANVTALAIDSQSILVSWDPPSFDQQNGLIRHYIINVTEEDTGYSFMQRTTRTEFSFYSLHPHYTYAFSVAAETIEVGPPSSILTTETEEDVPSGPVKNAVAEVTSPNSIMLRWDLPEADHQNGEITGYVVDINVMESGEQFELITNLTSLNVDFLQPFTTYLCRIAARTSVGTGPYSITITATTLQDVPSSAPQNVSGYAVSSSSIVLSWVPPTADERNGIIIVYRITITEVDTGSVRSLVSHNTQIGIHFLHPYYTYICTVSAVTVGEGPFSEDFSVRTLEDVPSDYPQDFVGIASTSRSANFTWDPPPVDHQNGIISEYLINITDAVSGDTLHLSTSETSLSINFLQPFTIYFCVISSATSVGVGPHSTVFTLETPEDAPSRPPTNLNGVALASTIIHLSWNAPDGDYHNGIIREYRVILTEVESETTIYRNTSTSSVTITTLHPFYTYEWTVSAVTVGEGPRSHISTINTPEDVPSSPPENLIGEALNSDEVFLMWDPLPRPDHNGIITGYVINITALDTGNTAQISTHFNNATLDGLKPFTTYFFIVAAQTSIGVGPFSTFVSIKTLEDAPSRHPSNSTGYSLNSTHIYLVWDPPPLEESNGVIREYHINVTERETGNLLQYTTEPDILTLIIGPLHPFYTYNCIIAAYTVDVGPTTEITVVTEEDAPGGPPTNFVATISSSTSMHLSWNSPEADVLNGILRHYIISLVSNGVTVSRNVTSSKQSVIITGLKPYTEYSCTVQAETVSVGPPTSTINRTTLEDTPAGPPQLITAEANDPTTLTLHWQPPLLGDRNGVIRVYFINITELESGTVDQHITTEQTIVISSLHPHYVYQYSVAAQTIGLGPFSSPSTIQMPEDASSSPPVNIRVLSITSSSFLLSWDSPPLESQNGVIRNYSIAIRELNTNNIIQLVSQATFQSVDSLHPYYNYSIQVAAVTVRNGPYSQQKFISTLSDVPSGAPQYLMVTTNNSRSLLMTWEPPSEENWNGILIGYTVVVTTTSGFSTQHTTTDTWLIITSLNPFTTYVCTVAASTDAGLGPHSMMVTETTPEDAPEAPPTELAVTNVTSNSMLLLWTAPQDDLQNGVIRHYEILVVELNSGKNYTYRATPTTTFRVGELHPFYTYSITMQAVTVAAGPPSSALVISTLEDIPSSYPTDIQATPVDATTLTITWNSPPLFTHNGNITQYFLNVSTYETEQRLNYVTYGETSITLDDLHPHYVYCFIVAAATLIGVGPYSETESIRMPQDTPSAPPTNVLATVESSRSILLSWEPPLISEQNGIITGYSVQITDLTTNNTYTFYPTSHTEFLIQQLRPHYEYQCSVAAMTAVGSGPFSSPITLRTEEDVPSGSPVNVQARTVDSTTIELQWELPLPGERNGIVIFFQVNVTATETKSTLIVNSTNDMMNITSLHPHYHYSLAVAATTSKRVGPYSQPVTAITFEDAPTGAPLNVSAVPVGSRSALLSWEAPTVDTQNGIIRAYNISVVELESRREWSFVSSGMDTYRILSSLHPFYWYNCTIAAYTITSGPIGFTLVQTLPEEPSDVPQGVNVTVLSATSVLVSWQPPPPEHRNGLITGYIVRVAKQNTEDGIYLPLTNDTEMVVNNLHPFYIYRYSVAAYTVAIGPFSAPMAQKLPESTPLGVVTDIYISVLTPKSVLLSWLPTANNNWNGIVLHYTINYELLGPVDQSANTSNYESDTEEQPMETYSITIPDNGRPLANSPDPNLVLLPLKNESVKIEGLEEFHIYRFVIFYANSRGTSNSSSPVILNTDIAAPSSPPTNVTAIPLDSSSIEITWNLPPPLDRNGPISGFLVELTSGVDGGKNVYNLSESDSLLHIEGLQIFMSYTVAVAAMTSVGVGPYSSPIHVKTDENVPGAPQNVTGKVLNTTSINLSWSKPQQPNGVILEYQIIYYTHKTTSTMEIQKIIVVPSNMTSITVTDLIPGLNYAFTVRAKTSVGYGNDSTVVTVKVDDVPNIETAEFGLATLPVSVTIPLVASGWVLALLTVVVVIAAAVYRKWSKKKNDGGVRNLVAHMDAGQNENLYTLSNNAALDGQEPEEK